MEEPNPPENRNINTGGGNYNERIEGDYIQNNFIKNIFNILSGQTTTPVGNPARPKNERLLLAAVKEEVTARLRQSLHNAVLINLGKESQPQQVKRPWDAEIKIGLKPAEPLPETTTILEVFDSEEIAGKLLILGAPGSGKTTTQLELAQALVKRAEEQPDYPVPVLLNLSSWKDDRQSITDWLAAELKSKYGVSTKLGKEWLDNRQLLLLLDGLDELEPQRQELCIQAINQFIQGEYRPPFLVVSSRSEEYTLHKTKFYLNAAIYLQELTDVQIDHYLSKCNRIQLRELLANDIYLSRLVKTPLFLNIVLLVYQQIKLEQWQQLDIIAYDKLSELIKGYLKYLKYILADNFTQKILFCNFRFYIYDSFEVIYQFMLSQSRINFLLNAYIERMLVRDIKNNPYKEKNPNSNKIKSWLVWLAIYMERESKSEFIIEHLQPSSLDFFDSSYFYKRIYSIILVGSPVFVLAFLQLQIPNTWLNISILGVKSSNILLILMIAILNFSDILLREFDDFYLRIKPFESVRFSWMKSLKTFINLAWYGIPIGLTLSKVTRDALNLNSKLNPWQIILITSVVFGIFGALNSCLVEADIKSKIKPNQGIQTSVVNALMFTGFFGILVGVTSGFYLGAYSGILFGVVSGFFGGLIFGGLACVQHFLLRLFLYINGYSPWNYARFLDYSTERLFLQRVGGRYRFIHKLLQDHFAQMEFRKP